MTPRPPAPTTSVMKRTCLLAALCLFAGSALGAAAPAESHSWPSSTLGGDIALTLHEPTSRTDGPLPVVFYLLHLAAPRVGAEADDTILRDLRADGFLVVCLDYRGDARARWPSLAPDLVALRRQLQHHQLLAGRALDIAHIFIVPSGCRLRRDVVFYRDAARILAMDIVYPSQPAKPVGAVLEFSCDNADRMGNFSLDFCTDTLIAGAAIEGFAAAMADHPVPAPYKGFDPIPDVAWKTKAAVRTLRAQSAALGLAGRIVPVGFSRGSGMALLLATTAGREEFDGHGEHRGVDSSVQGGVILSGRFTYLDLLPDDHMIPRYDAVWGSRAAHEDVWRAQGALDDLGAPTVPLFLSINRTESPDALHQMDVLRRRLTALHSPFEFHLEEEARGHRVPLAPAVLDPLLAYLKRQLN